MASTTKEDILQEISNGNLNPKILTQFFADMKIKSFAYDYLIQRDLVHLRTENFTLNPAKIKNLYKIFDKTVRGIEYEIPFEILAIGRKAAYVQSPVYGKPMDYSTLTKNMKYFRNNIIMFVDGEIYLNYRVIIKQDKVKFYFEADDLHKMAVKHSVADKPDTIVKDVKVLFVPNSVIDIADDLIPGMVAGQNIDARNFDNSNFLMFNETKSYFGFWIHKPTGTHFMIPFMTWNAENKYFTVEEGYIPTIIEDFQLMVVGTNIYTKYYNATPEDKYLQYTSEQMPVPKDNLMVFIKRDDLDVYTPNDGSITIKEYYPNIYEIDNPDGKYLRILVLSDERAHNDHIIFDNEIAPYMKRINLLDAYKYESVPDLIKEFNPIKWVYSIYDYLVSIGEVVPDLSDYPMPESIERVDSEAEEISTLFHLEERGGWEPFIYKMNTISNTLKKWFYFYEEYVRRTYGFLSGWYHRIAKYDNMEEKIRYDTSQETSSAVLQYTFSEPQYLFSYKNNSVYGTAKSYIFYIDGKYTIPTKIIVDHGYQYVYFPVSKINEDSVIEVERFDGLVLNKLYVLPEEGIKIKFSDISKVDTIANCLFLVNEETKGYLTKDDVSVYVIDPEVGRIPIDLATSVYAISTDMELELIPSEAYVDKAIRLCCNNKTFQFFQREDGYDFAREGYADQVNLNSAGYITSVNKSVMPRLRIYTKDGRMIPKRAYNVYAHDKYTDKPRFHIPIWTDKSIDFMIAYTGYDERLIYHREQVPPNGLVSFEGRTSRPFSFKYHDIYLDGYRLTKYDVEVISPYTIVLNCMEKFDTDCTLEIYEKKHVNDRFVKFEYEEKSEYIMDKLMDVDQSFRKYVENTLPRYTPSGDTEHVDDINDDWYDFWRYYLPFHFINGNSRKDLEAYFHCFGTGMGRILLNADDRVKYTGLIYAVYYFSHDLEIEEGNKDVPYKEVDENMLVVDESIDVPEEIYKREGYKVPGYNPVYDDPFSADTSPVPEPTEEDEDASKTDDRYLPDREFPHITFDERYLNGN